MAIYVRDESGVLQTLRIPAYKGEKGEAGITPNIQIGDVITLESGQQATVVRRGDDENPIFDFAIPKGEDGKDGIFVGSIDDAPEHAQIVINDDPSPYDLFYEDANVSYMGDTYTSLKEKADADIEYLLRKFATQHYEGTNIVATDTYAKQVKDAMFKGRTLVNLIVGGGERKQIGLSGGTKAKYSYIYPLDHTKVYTLFFKVSGFVGANSLTVSVVTGHLGTINISQDGIYKVLVNPKSGYENKMNALWAYWEAPKWSDGNQAFIENVMMLEGDYTNVEISYFEGMKSVKAPIVKMTGKNLFDGELKMVNLTDGGEEQVSKQLATTSNFIKVFSQMTFKSYDLVRGDMVVVNRFIEYDENKNFIRRRPFPLTNSCTYTPTDSNVKYVKVTFRTPALKDITLEEFKSVKIQIEEGSVATTYESHKSNTLTLPEEVVLRSLPGGVCDTFNTRTGEYVQRIGEVVLNGSGSIVWSTSDYTSANHYAFYTQSIDGARNAITKVYCDKLPYMGSVSEAQRDREGCMISSSGRGHGNILIKLSSQKIKNNASSLNEYLKQNPITVQYELAEPVITTVDLQGQKIYSYDGTTHYTTASAQGHPAPILSIDVPTNTTKMIARQREEIEQQEQKLQEQEEVQNVLIESQLAWYEDNVSTLELTDEDTPSHIQKLYGLTRKCKVGEE